MGKRSQGQWSYDQIKDKINHAMSTGKMCMWVSGQKAHIKGKVMNQLRQEGFKTLCTFNGNPDMECACTQRDCRCERAYDIQVCNVIVRWDYDSSDCSCCCSSL